jgi:hypothetical protein
MKTLELGANLPKAFYNVLITDVYTYVFRGFNLVMQVLWKDPTDQKLLTHELMYVPHSGTETARILSHPKQPQRSHHTEL